MNSLRILFFVFSVLLLVHAARDFLHYRKSESWFAQVGHKKAKCFFDSTCDNLGLSFLKDKEWLHVLICAFFGLVFLAAALFLK